MIIIAVTNDLIIDQRVDRIARTLTEKGKKVLLIGRRLKTSIPVDSRTYDTYRFKLLINKGFLFYLNYNLRLFIYLLAHKAELIVSNDLDTLPACFLTSKIKHTPLIYDSHELFTEVPELTNRKLVKTIWQKIESLILPRIKYSYTVCRSIADIYKNKYGIDMYIVRNLPFRGGNSLEINGHREKNTNKIIIYQGALNLGRGIEAVIEAMEHINGAEFWIAGCGDIENDLKALVEKKNLSNKIIFKGRIPFGELYKVTTQAHLGISLEENLGLNYYYSLPNKLFDYIQAGVPVLTSDFPEMARIVNNYNIGATISDKKPENLAIIISEMLSDESKRAQWEINLKRAANELCWENEREVLIKIYQKAGILQ